MGESCTKSFKYQNSGALETEIVIKNKRGIGLGEKYDASSSRASSIRNSKGGKSMTSLEEENEDDKYEALIISQLTFEKISKIKGYSNLVIPIIYKPTEVGPFELVIQAYFENYLHSPAIIINLV